MRSPSNPVLTWMLFASLAVIGTALAVSGAVWWGLHEVRDATLTALEDPPAGLGSEDADDPFSRKGFAARIWTTPPLPLPVVEQKPTSPPPSPPKLNLELLGIAQYEGGDANRDTRLSVAIIYEPKENEVYKVRQGDTVAGAVCVSIADGKITLLHQDREHVLKLDPEAGS